MYFGADYHPEHWVYPYAGTPEDTEARWKEDIELMIGAGMNIVRMGEFVWGLCEPREGEFDFSWLKRIMDLMGAEDIKVVLATPTAAPPIWLTKKHPEVLPMDERGLPLCEGTRHACCLNSDLYWDYSKKMVRAMAEALGSHPQLFAWQIDNNVGAHSMQPSFNEETRRDWHLWLQAKYQSIDRLNDMMGTRFWGQTVTDWTHVPLPRVAPAPHNPALMLDWRRFCSDTIVAFVRMQAELLHEVSPQGAGDDEHAGIWTASGFVRHGRRAGFRVAEQQRDHQIQVVGECLRGGFCALAQEGARADTLGREEVFGSSSRRPGMSIGRMSTRWSGREW